MPSNLSLVSQGPAALPPQYTDIIMSGINWAYIAWWNSINRTYCIYCHTLLTRDTWTKDHVISRHHLRLVDSYFTSYLNQMNLVPCCPACQNEKGSKSAHEWPGLVHKPGGVHLLKLLP